MQLRNERGASVEQEKVEQEKVEQEKVEQEKVEHENVKQKNLESYLAEFDEKIKIAGLTYQVEEVAPFCFRITPPASELAPDAVDAKEKPLALVVTAMIHGVEVVGVAVLVEILSKIIGGQIALKSPIGFALGNIAAAKMSKRFVDRDLNRSFGRHHTQNLEDRRADELESLLISAYRYLDIHQVSQPIDRPFWIFPYSKNGYQFARAVRPDVSLVTHWGRGFSAEGQCSDEWVNAVGGVGVTIELGQNGFDPQQIASGVSTVERAIDIAQRQQMAAAITLPDHKTYAPLYTWGEIIPYPPTGAPVLDAGWKNFAEVKAGQRLGYFNGQEIIAGVSGPVLFPKYPVPLANGEYAKEPPANEMIRILKPIEESELPVAYVT